MLGIQKDVELTLGITENDKITTTLFLTGTNLKAAVEGNEAYIIDGNDKIGSEITQSKTTIPDLIIIFIGPDEDVELM